MRPTSPFRTADTIRRAWAAFTAEEGIDSLRAVEKVTQHPGKMWLVEGKRMTPLLKQPSGGAALAFEPDGGAAGGVCAECEPGDRLVAVVVDEGRTIAGKNIMPFFTSEAEGFDINNQYDWDYAEAAVAQGKFALPEVAEAPFVATTVSEGRVG